MKQTKTIKLEQVEKIKTDYYNDITIKKIFEDIIYPNKTYREFALLNSFNFRTITFSDLDFFKKTIFNKAYPYFFYKNFSSCYVSVARVKQFPALPFNREIRNVYTKKFHTKEYYDYIKYYDFYLDFDLDNLENIEEFLKEIEKMIKIIKQFSLKAEIVYSGSRGFKILIYNYSYSKKWINKAHHKIKNNLGLIYLDNVGSFLHNKLMKCNYTLALKPIDRTNEKLTCRYVFPLKENNYKKFFGQILKDKNFNVFDYPNKQIEKIMLDYENSNFLENGRYDKKTSLKKFMKSYGVL